MNTLNLDIIQEAVNMVAQMSNSYFWVPPTLAADRRAMEKKYSLFYIGEYQGQELKIDFSTNVSCHNIYFYKNIYLDGVRKDVRLLKKILKEADVDGKI